MPATQPHPPAALAGLRQLQQAAGDAKHRQFATQNADTWRGFAFHIEELNLVFPQRDGLQIAQGGAHQALPLCRDWVRGTMAAGDALYCVIDFAHFIGRRPAARQNANLLLIRGEAFNSALLLDGRISLRVFAGDAAAESAPAANANLTPYVRARQNEGGQIWEVLDADKLLNSSAFIRLGRD